MKKFLSTTKYTLLLAFLLAPFRISAQTTPGDSQVMLNRPDQGTELKGVTDNALNVFTNIFNLVAGIAFALATLSLVVNGIRYIAAFGSEDQIKKARSGLLYTIIGISILILSYTIVSTINIIFVSQPAGS